MTEKELRDKIVEAAKTWQGTPFHDCVGLKGVGVDCAYLPVRVVNEAGVFPEPIPDPPLYSSQAMLHTSEEIYVREISRYAREIEEKDIKPGDFVLYHVGRSFSHGAIVVEWPHYIIHPVLGKGVIGSHGTEEGFIRRRKRRYFTLF